MPGRTSGPPPSMYATLQKTPAFSVRAKTQASQTAPTPPCETSKKASSKASKAQRRAQQAEFNRQLWAEA